MSEEKRPKLERVWQPIQLGPHTLKHRIVMTPHGLGWNGSNIPRERHVAYLTERAKGGAALVQCGATPVHRRDWDPANGPDVASDSRVVPLYEALANSVHEHGAKVMVELAEGGVHNWYRSNTGTWLPSLGVSQMPSITHNNVPQVLDKATIREIQEHYARACANLKHAGIDGATLHAAHSYLLGQFMSPAYNWRDDEYGGSVRNRCRFLIETAEMVREAVGRDKFALGVRLSYDEYIGEAGITPEMSDEYVSILVETGLFDFFDISAGGYHSGERFVPPNVLPTPHIASYAKRARDIVAGRAIIIMAHRVRTVDIAERLLEEGVTDLVAMTRAHMADPFLVTKAREGKFDEITRCVGTNECVYNSHMRFNHACTVNPINGRERKWGHGTLVKAENPRRIAVVGGGPAGLRFAATAARRGHQIELFEQSDKLGGHINELGAVPLHATWYDLIEDLTGAAERAGAVLKTGVKVDAQMIKEQGYDAAIVATGSIWDATGITPARPGRGGIPGLSTHQNVVTLPDAIRKMRDDDGSISGNVLIIDDTGAYLPLGLAEWLLNGGSKVTVISRRNTIGEIPRETWEYPLFMQRTRGMPLTQYPNALVERVEGTTVYIENVWRSPILTQDFDWIVISGVRFSNDSLAGELAAVGVEAHVIGDARAPRRTADAIYEGEKFARGI